MAFKHVNDLKDENKHGYIATVFFHCICVNDQEPYNIFVGKWAQKGSRKYERECKVYQLNDYSSKCYVKLNNGYLAPVRYDSYKGEGDWFCDCRIKSMVVPFEPEEIAKVCEKALSVIHASGGLPLNPDSVYHQVQLIEKYISRKEVVSYMEEMYGWCDDPSCFSSERRVK